MRFKKLIGGLVFVLGICITGTAQAKSSHFISVFDQTGYFDYDVQGFGLATWNIHPTKPWKSTKGKSLTKGSVSLDIKGTPVFGQVLWHGFGHGDRWVRFNNTPLRGIGLKEAPGGEKGIGYWQEITRKLSVGKKDYHLENVSFGNGKQNNGFSVTAVYEDPSKTKYGRLIIANGNDYAYHKNRYNNGPNTEVLSFNIDPVDYDRNVELTMSFAGGEGDVRGIERRSYIWYYTAQGGAVPAQLVDNASAIRLADATPISGRDGFDWDTYSTSILVPKHSSVIAFQVESDDEYPNTSNPSGESFALVSTTVFVSACSSTGSASPLCAPTVVPEPGSIVLFGTGLVLAGLKRRGKFNKKI